MLKIPISFYKEQDIIDYEENDQEELEDWEIQHKMLKGEYKEEKPKEYRTHLYLKKEDVSSFHPTFLTEESEELDATAICTSHGQMYVCTLDCEEFFKIYNDGI